MDRRPSNASISTTELAGILGHWAGGDDPLYEQLADAIERAIGDTSLRPGTLLPPQRSMASALCVSRTTIIAAIDRLREDGWLRSAQGSGTWVAPRDATIDEVFPDQETMASYRVRRLVRESAPRFRRTVLDLGTALFDDSMGVDQALESASREDYDALHQGGGFAPAGTPELRAELAETLTARGLPTEPEQLCITTGGQQALWLLASLYTRHGRPTVVEDPTWSAALDAIRAVGAQTVSVPVDRFGVIVPDLSALLERVRPSMILITPEFHNPTGARLHEVRRAAIARLGAQYQVPIVEDFSLWGLTPSRNGGEFVSLGRFDQAAEVVTFGTMTKLFWRGLRVGWIRAPQPTISRLAKMKAAIDAGTPVVSQLAAARSLRELDRVREARVNHVTAAWELLEDWAHGLEPRWSFETPAGGLSVWAELPLGNAVELSQVALRHGVEIWPGPAFSASEKFDAHLRIPLTRPLSHFATALSRLGEAWQSYAGLHPGGSLGPRSAAQTAPGLYQVSAPKG